jgi:hypothetical protein
MLLGMADELDELTELAALYRVQRRRIDRLVEIEAESGRPTAQMAREIQVATQLLIAREQIKIDLGLDGVEKRAQEDPRIALTGYSERTQQALSNPESRHRIIAIIERMARLGEREQKRGEVPALTAPGGEAE